MRTTSNASGHGAPVRGQAPGPERRLDELAHAYRLTAATRARLSALLRALAQAPHAPSAVRDPERAVEVHIADSLAALDLDFIHQARWIADLGSGAGFPGLALAAALPRAQVSLVESAARKAAVIEALAGEAAIDNARPVALRAEAWPEGIGRYDVVTARALAPLPVVLEYAAPLLRERGAVVAWKGRRDAAEEAAAAVAAQELGLTLEPARPVRPHRGARHRHLYVARKLRPTPARFPRRPGMAAKRPLGGRSRSARSPGAPPTVARASVGS
jgi:16S rRNA (guanine527-N7)-methyltransferase